LEGKPFIDHIHPDDVEKTYKEVGNLLEENLVLKTGIDVKLEVRNTKLGVSPN
jgi:hypothetical protein